MCVFYACGCEVAVSITHVSLRLFLSVRFALVLCTSVRWVSAPSHAVSATVSRLGQALITVQAAVFLKGVVGRGCQPC